MKVYVVYLNHWECEGDPAPLYASLYKTNAESFIISYAEDWDTNDDFYLTHLSIEEMEVDE